MKNTILLALALVPAAASAQVAKFGVLPLQLPTPFSIATDPALTFPGANSQQHFVPTVVVPSLIPTGVTLVAAVSPSHTESPAVVVAQKPVTVTALRPSAFSAVNLSALKNETPAKTAAGEKGSDASRQKLDEKFDGRKGLEKDPVIVSDSRHVSLPERDLEAEIGAY